MDSPVSPLIANLVMEDLEKECLRKLKESHNYSPLFYFSYVDDTLLCIKRDKLDLILKIFNEDDKNYKFTNEIERNISLSFLEVLIIRSGGKLITAWYKNSKFI